MNISVPANAPRVVVVLSTGFSREWFDEIERTIPGPRYTAVPDKLDAMLEAMPGAAALIGCPRRLFSAEMLAKAGPSLRWIHLGGAGCEEFMIPELVESDITLTNGKILQGPPVADHAMALLLALTRNLHLLLRPNPPQPLPRAIELRDRTAVVVGVGGIGMLVAERLRSFGMRVIGVDEEYVPITSFLDRTLPPERIHEVLPAADAVIVAAPNTQRSRGMFGAREFALMKPTSIFVLVSRGALVQTNALVEALRQGRPGSAALDVTDPEPLPADHPLRSMPNAIVTPHVAGLSDQNRARNFDLVKANMQRFVQGLPLFNVVDKRRGY